jgi:LPS sulfotransferase NodH
VESGADLAEIVQAAKRTGSGEGDLFGMRLQRHSFEFFMRQLDLLNPGCSSDAARIEAAFGRTLFVYLNRADKLDQAISYVKAAQTGLWLRAPDGTEIERMAPPAAPVYDHEQLAQQFDAFQKMAEAWEAWFDVQKITPIWLSYEALADQPGQGLNQILAALGRRQQEIEPSVARLADQVNLEWAERFRSEASA